VDHGLIDTYVESMRRSLRWRRDVDDVIDEIEDHLRERVGRLVASGVAPGEAQRQTLARFGDLATVSRSFAQAPTGGLAVPTRATRTAGLVGLGASVAWVAAIVGGAAGGHTELLTAWTLERYQIWLVLLVVAAGLTTVTVAGVLLRAGRLRRPAGVVAVVVGALVTAALAQLAWAVTGIMVLFGFALLVGFRGDAGTADRFVRPMRALGGAWLLGIVAVYLGDEVYQVGPVNTYGDHALAWLLPFCACAATSALTLALVGVRLSTERPADLDGAPSTPIGAS
jgi:hypothetical protein